MIQELTDVDTLNESEEGATALIGALVSKTEVHLTLLRFAKVFLNTLPDDKILDWSKLKQTADDTLTLSQTGPGFYVSAVNNF